jgi:hypothetical protein
MENLDKSLVTEEMIKKEIKKIVFSLNEYDKSKPFIETVEREDLCEFIDKVIVATGYKIHKDRDYTLEWRTW